MMELAARIEQADGPSYVLDCEIAETIWRIRWGKKRPKDIRVPNYTASVDAAMTLVPDGWCWMAGERNIGRGRAYVNNGKLPMSGKSIWHEVVAATPALALCAAALRAGG